MDSSHVWAAFFVAVVCVVLGWFVPALIARIPEPEPQPEPEPAPAPTPEPGAEQRVDSRGLFSTELPPAPPKEPYVEIAARPRLALWTSMSAAVAGAGVGGAVGWSGALAYLVPFVPVAIALFVVDWRTTLLPSWIVKPAYPTLLGLILLAALLDHDLDALKGVGWGWLVFGGWFLAFWFLTGGGGWGYGDVRLAGLLGLALGYLGWPETIVGLLLTFVCGSVGAIAQAVRQRSLRGRLPYGPYMLAGAWLGILLGPLLAAGAGY